MNYRQCMVELRKQFKKSRHLLQIILLLLKAFGNQNVHSRIMKKKTIIRQVHPNKTFNESNIWKSKSLIEKLN